MSNIQLAHPYADIDFTDGQWLRGNLHSHTTRSDGRRDPQVVLDDYADRGYDYLMISDHDIFTSAEDYRQWNDRGLILIPGNEISRNGPHLLHVGADRFLEPDPQRQNIMNVVNDGDAGGARGFIIVNHPNWQRFDHCPLTAMQYWVGYAGLEIYNGTIGRLHGSPYATNKWDMLLDAGRRVWGYATDDAHSADDVELGWTYVWVRERTVDAVVDALRHGRCYASTGVQIERIETDGPLIRVHAPNARRICALGDLGKRLKVADDATIEIEAPDTMKYVRFECWGDGEQFAWTQPFFIEPTGEDSA